MNFERILICHDGSENAENALKRFRTENIEIIHVVHIPKMYAGSGIKTFLYAEAEKLSQRIKKEYGLKLHIVEYESIHEAIISYALQNNIDLIVVGKFGSSNNKKRIIGSISEELVRISPISVLISIEK